jgi:hypothetical protein
MEQCDRRVLKFKLPALTAVCCGVHYFRFIKGSKQVSPQTKRQQLQNFNNDGQINVHGDFNVTDNSRTEHKLLINCSSEELLQDRPFRLGNIRLEQARKIKRLQPLYALSVVLLVAAAGWATINGKPDLAALVTGGASLFVGYLSLNATLEPNSFQIEEQNAANEASKLLKQRRVE